MSVDPAGVTCSAMRVRRLVHGELLESERGSVEAHVDGCGRCRRTVEELREEREALRRDAPFPAFAAGVAEKLAAGRTKPRLASRMMGVAAAAAAVLRACFARGRR
jgi:anti-sigma factor RsiW